MKNIRQLLCILVMTLLMSAAAFAEIDTVYLTAGTWLYKIHHLNFRRMEVALLSTSLENPLQ